MTTDQEVVSSHSALDWPFRFAPGHMLCGEFFPLPKDITILSLFERQAKRIPNHPAIIFAEQILSFSELDAKANDLAGSIANHNIKRGDLVPIICSNGFELPIAMLAIMKTGAAFVPLDSAWPNRRSQDILRSLNPKLILVDGSASTKINSLQTHLLIDNTKIAGHGLYEFRQPDNQEDLIYGFFTSGSTREPKCCLNIHRGLLNRFLYMNRTFGCQAHDVILQNSKHIFDSSIWQLLWPLTNGNTVVIPQREGLLDLDRTIDIIQSNKVTMTDFVPSIFNILVTMLEADSQRIAKISSLRHLLIGGEEINSKAIRTFRTMLPEVGITNTYGPTEASIGMVFHTITDQDNHAIPLGKPIANTFALITDNELRALPPGEIGEIIIGGECLGRGYLNDPTQTANSFFFSPLLDMPGIRLYRTGDLGCIDDNGHLLFKGRKDFQIKINGVRIELGEIESALLNCSDITDAKVIAKTGTDGRIHLVGFVVTTAAADITSLRSRLGDLLPASFIPQCIVPLDRMPLTANGKVDRKQLLKQLDAPIHNANPLQHLSVEEHMVAAWRETFAIDNIDVNSHFFDLGGNSLLAIILSLKLEKIVGRAVNTKDLYNYPRLVDLMKFLDSKIRSKPSPCHDTEMALAVEDIQLARGLPNITNKSASVRKAPRRILLTGATGFIGAHLLAELLTTTQANIYCLALATHDKAALTRVRQALTQYGLSPRDFEQRVIPVQGDLAQVRFGLDDSRYNKLAQDIDTIVHNAAVVDFLKSYRSLRDVNVLGTLEILKLLGTGPPKQLHYVSSLSVFSRQEQTDSENLIPETAIPSCKLLPDDGYSQTKWVTEHMITNSCPSAQIYRLGEIMPSTSSGIGNSKSLLLLLIKGAMLLRQYPDMHFDFDYTPVDITSRLMVKAMLNRSNWPQVYHLFNPQSITYAQVMTHLTERGQKLTKVSYTVFLQSIKSACRQSRPDPDLLALLSILSNSVQPTGGPEIRNACSNAMFSAPNHRFSALNSRRLASSAAIQWPPVSQELLEPMLDQLLETYTCAVKTSHPTPLAEA